MAYHLIQEKQFKVKIFYKLNGNWVNILFVTLLNEFPVGDLYL